MSRGSYDDFLNALGVRESSGKYDAVNTLNFIGKYQMGEAALVDIGMVNLDANPFDNNYSGGFTGKYGVTSKADFLNSPAAQESAIRDYMLLQFSYLESVHHYEGQTLNGVPVTLSGMLAGAHLVGWDSVVAFLDSGGSYVPKDAYGVAVTEYMKLMADYDIPFSVDHTLAEVIDGGFGKDSLAGRGGNDTLKGMGSADRISGGTGGDTISGGTSHDVIAGNGGHDRLKGDAGNDILNGGSGNDILAGGLGDDVFAFAPGLGKDVIVDFAEGDLLRLSLGTDFDSLAEVKAHAKQTGADTVITVGATSTITLKNVDVTSLTHDDFHFA